VQISQGRKRRRRRGEEEEEKEKIEQEQRITTQIITRVLKTAS